MATGAFSLPFSRTARAVQSALNPTSANDGKVIW
ncbi:hypothetical protein YPPY90_3853, partial [Yersinia pestis PY-90]